MKIKTKIYSLFLFIILLLLTTTYINYNLTSAVNANTDWIKNSQEILKNVNRLQRNIITTENALNAFFVVKDSAFFQLVTNYQVENSQLLKETRRMVDSKQNYNLKEIEKAYKTWLKYFAGNEVIDSLNRYNPNLEALKSHSKKGQELQKQLDRLFKQFVDFEYELREQKRKELASSIENTRQRSIMLFAISVLIGLSAVYVITNVISKRINGMVALADQMAHGSFKRLPEDTSKDELTALNNSLNIMSSRLSSTITELKRRNEELDGFAYVVSHDLKAPLVGIDNLSLWIEEDMPEGLPEDIKEFLVLIRARIKRMKALIDGILELSRIGKTKNLTETVDVTAMANQIVTYLQPPEKFDFKIDKLPILRTEKIYLEQVFTNLISNAIKYNDKERGFIEIGCIEKDREYEFYVRDDGPGIEPEYREKIFEIFQTLNSRDFIESTGIGLTIVKKILENKNCTVYVESSDKTGSTFKFTWPKTETNG